MKLQVPVQHTCMVTVMRHTGTDGAETRLSNLSRTVSFYFPPEHYCPE